jgi:hypothetical protein
MRLRHLLATLCSLGVVLVLPLAAGAAEIVDRNVAAPTLQVDSHNVALVSYSVRGTQRHVLYWGAVDWADTFRRDYSGGWKSKVADYKRFSDNCGQYTGASLPYMIAACDAPDGSHWALQKWARLWDNYGGDSAPVELYISHWTGDIGDLTVQTDWGYHGKHEHLWGSFQFHGKPVFGNKWTLQGVPLDKAGRNVYVDYADNGSWKRENSFLTHRGTGGFCYLFGTQGGRDSGVMAPTYRATVIGPGVSPLVRNDFAPPPPFSPETDAQANALQRAAFGQDDMKRCAIN